MNHLLPYLEANKKAFLDELFALLRIPSISADGAYKADVRRAAEFLVDNMRAAGVQGVELCETAGHPIVYGEVIVDAALPTVLVYGHYDVQPPDPIELWESGPFEPVIKNEKIVCRGACEIRGRCLRM
jgi:acetylornithine deacetylase/succinyl-diaminopimelate desuccinylase-like protein